jgi:C4-dicarboxylate transporter DctM subunit
MPIAMIIVLFGALALGIPVSISIALAAMGGIALFTDLPLLVAAQQLYVSLDSFPLIAIPLFILAGNLMEAGGVSTRLVDVAKAMVGRGTGGLAAACVVACLIFGSVSGSSVATTFAVGAILIPALVKQGYPRPFAAALQATSAEMAVILPPSIPMILFGVSTGTSIGALFMAGIVPALILALGLIVLVYVWSTIKGWGKTAADDDSDGQLSVTRAVRVGLPALLMPIIIVGGIYGGIFTPSESAVVAVFYALLVGGLVYRELTFANILEAFKKSAAATGFILLTLGAAGFFTFLINRTGAPAAMVTWLTSIFHEQWTFLVATNVFLFFVGMFIETAAAILVLAPLLLPVAVALGVDPVHFGMIMTVNMALGMVTPPIGVNLFAACSVAGVPIEKVAPMLIPFIAVVFSTIILITYVPAVSLWLPSLLTGN